jgi:hypothetical protein
MYLIDWFQANLLMTAVVIVLLGIPVVIGIIVFGQRSKEAEDE